MTEYDEEICICNTFSNMSAVSKHTQTEELKMCQVLFLCSLKLSMHYGQVFLLFDVKHLNSLQCYINN